MRDYMVALDIETDTTPCHIPEKDCCVKKGLDPAISSIVAVALSDENGDRVLNTASCGGEANLLSVLNTILTEKEGELVTWNGAAFDLPFVADRAAYLGVPLGLELNEDLSIYVKYEPLPGHKGAYKARWGMLSHTDIQDTYRTFSVENQVKWSLKAVSRALGFKPIEVDRTSIHTLTEQQLTEYVASDARLTLALAKLSRQGA
jgi:DNA polymerase elongation subunit (family B)